MMPIIPKEVLYRKMYFLHNAGMAQRSQTELFCDWLENFLNYERFPKKGGFSLDTMRFLVERFNHPEQSFSSVHVAGSKGKGSVSAMISRVIEESGTTCGLYTSPHMLDFSERVGSASGPFSDELYGKACDILIPLVDSIIPEHLPGGKDPSWFELVTLFAFVAFREAPVEWAVVETGLGGRLDATNVIIPRISVITPIELEHCEYLGSTLEQIAKEKAGIIKPGVAVFVAPQQSVVRKVFEHAAYEKGSPIFFLEDLLEYSECIQTDKGLQVTFSFRNSDGAPCFSRHITSLLTFKNPIQLQNAALSALAVKYLFPDLEETVIASGLSKAWLPGRFEIIRNNPLVVLDGAHTVSSITLTRDAFSSVSTKPARLLFACAADKNVERMAEILCPFFTSITLTRPGDRKESDLGHTETAFKQVISTMDDEDTDNRPALEIEENFEKAIRKVWDASAKEATPLLVTGSFYLVAEMKRILSSQL